MKKVSKVLSISVAAYNLGEMIRDNLESFINADPKILDKIEVIVTNDGSSDNTAEIVEEYAKKYPNSIILVNQKNKGAGSTVNSGIKYATGKYFKMIDGDDWVKTETLNILIPKLEKCEADLVLTDHIVFNETKQKITGRGKYSIETNQIQQFKNVSDKIDIQMHNTMYKTSVLKDNAIKLDNGFYTDIEYVLLPLPFVKTIEYFNDPFYVYRVSRNGQSMSKSSMRKNFKQHRLVLERLIDEFHSYEPKMMPETRRYIINAIGRMANTELRVLLLKELENREKKIDIESFFEWLRAKDLDIYRSFLTGRKARILKFTNYRAVPILGKAIEHKFY